MCCAFAFKFGTAPLCQSSVGNHDYIITYSIKIFLKANLTFVGTRFSLFDQSSLHYSLFQSAAFVHLGDCFLEVEGWR